jgi:hypothetical protein
MIKPITPVLFVVALAACAAPRTPGAQPHEMSAAQHEAAAKQLEQGAALHQAQYNPEAAVTTKRCNPRSATCWTSTTNPTAEHLEEAKKLRQMAADHRAGSQALRDAESQACAGLSDEDRDIGPFTHREDIASVEPLTESANTGYEPATRIAGAVVTFRAVPGMTAQWLQRLANCHLARNAALGHDVPEMPYCPLVPKGVTATVAPTSTGFAVTVRSDDQAAADEVLRRAQTLVSP